MSWLTYTDTATNWSFMAIVVCKGHHPIVHIFEPFSTWNHQLPTDVVRSLEFIRRDLRNLRKIMAPQSQPDKDVVLNDACGICGKSHVYIYIYIVIRIIMDVHCWSHWQTPCWSWNIPPLLSLQATWDCGCWKLLGWWIKIIANPALKELYIYIRVYIYMYIHTLFYIHIIS